MTGPLLQYYVNYKWAWLQYCSMAQKDADDDSTECIHCGAVDSSAVTIRVEKNEHGEHYTVCNICEKP